MAGSEKTRVVIAGGGVAAVEALLALGHLAGDLVETTLLAPNASFELRPLAVAAPFAASRERRRFPLAPLARAQGATLVQGAVGEVQPGDRQILTSEGETIDYDALIVAIGALAAAPFDHAMTFGADPLVFSALLGDMEQGYTRRVAFVVPVGTVWSLPAYELALMTRRQAVGMGMDPQITLITPERAPLGIFGQSASDIVGQLLDRARIELRTGARATVGPSGRVGLEPSDETLEFQRVVALPVLAGPFLSGLPHDDDGFIPIDEHARVVGLRDVYCAGDAANYPVKQGGLAAQQADAAALHVAARAGAAVRAEPFRPVLRGRLMTGDGDEYFVRELRRPVGRLEEGRLWWPPTKVSGRYLTPWIASEDPGVSAPELTQGAPIERELPSDPAAARREIMSSLGPPVPQRSWG